MEQVNISKKALIDLARLANELNDKVESLELASDSELMESLKRSKEQIKKGELIGFDDL